MRVYISGKIGEGSPSQETLAKFRRAEEMLRARGHEVFNPTMSGLGSVAETNRQMINREGDLAREFGEGDPREVKWYDCILVEDLWEVAKSHAIYLLDDWQLSPGAMVEKAYAEAIGIRAYFQNRYDACEYLVRRMYTEAAEAGNPIKYDGVRSLNDIEIEYFTKHLYEAWWPLEEEEAQP